MTRKAIVYLHVTCSKAVRVGVTSHYFMFEMANLV